MNNTTFIGIDFGTTKTLVSVYNENKQEAKIVRLGSGRDDIPTSAYVEEDGLFSFGEDAEESRATNPTHYARTFKMMLGSNEPVMAYYEGEKALKYFTAAKLTSEFLSYIRKKCEYLIDKEIKRAVITCPVRFSTQQRKQLEEAARAADFEEFVFITEPEAAAHTYCHHRSDDPFNNALIVDWGGGTLDMALVSRKDGQIRTNTKYTDGILRGGENFDDAIYCLARAHYEGEQGFSSLLDKDMMEPEFHYTIRKQLRTTKEALSRSQHRRLILSGSMGPYPAFEVQRSEFEQAIRADIENAANMACNLIDSISDPSLKPDRLILVGGSSRIPVVAQILQEHTGLPCHTWDMSVEAVGLGAALVAAEQWAHKPEKKSAAPENTLPTIEQETVSVADPAAAAVNEPRQTLTSNTVVSAELPYEQNYSTASTTAPTLIPATQATPPITQEFAASALDPATTENSKGQPPVADKPIPAWWQISFEGRIGLKDFWKAYAIILAIQLLCYLTIGLIIPAIFSIYFTIVYLGLGVRRIHDSGNSGKWIWLTVLDLFGGLGSFILIILFYIRKSK